MEVQDAVEAQAQHGQQDDAREAHGGVPEAPAPGGLAPGTFGLMVDGCQAMNGRCQAHF